MRREYEQWGIQVDAQSEDLGIMSSNWASFTAFLACQTQWRTVAGVAGLIWVGLDYMACKLVLDDLKAPARVFSDLRFMEQAALAVLNSDD